MVRSRAALNLRQSQFREKYIETSYIKLDAKPKYCNFKVHIEPWMAYCTLATSTPLPEALHPDNLILSRITPACIHLNQTLTATQSVHDQ